MVQVSNNYKVKQLFLWQNLKLTKTKCVKQGNNCSKIKNKNQNVKLKYFKPHILSYLPSYM